MLSRQKANMKNLCRASVLVDLAVEHHQQHGLDLHRHRGQGACNLYTLPWEGRDSRTKTLLETLEASTLTTELTARRQECRLLGPES